VEQRPGLRGRHQQPVHQGRHRSLHDVFNKETVFIRSGGSIPIVTDFQDVLKIPSS
jgi:hypothetical protein